MNIFKEIKENVYGPQYYSGVLERESLKPSLKYLAKISLIAALIGMVMFAAMIPVISSGIQQGITSAMAQYPADLVVGVKNGSFSINKPEPYVIPATEMMNEEYKREYDEEYTNFLVIDTTKPFSLEQFRSYSTMIWITKTELIGAKGSGGLQIIPLEKMGDFEITKPWLEEKVTYFNSILPLLFGIISIFFFGILFVMNFIGTLFMALFYGLIVFITSKIRKWDLSYKKSYMVAIHLSTVVMALGVIGLFIKPLDNSLLKLVVFIGVLFVNLPKNLDKPIETVTVASAPEQPKE